MRRLFRLHSQADFCFLSRMSKRTPTAETAETMAQKQREISVSEFFLKNRHLLGFDNPRKALLTAVKAHLPSLFICISLWRNALRFFVVSHVAIQYYVLYLTGICITNTVWPL
jgi:hypothetical protein